MFEFFRYITEIRNDPSFQESGVHVFKNLKQNLMFSLIYIFCDLTNRLVQLIICHQKQSKICLPQERMGNPNQRYDKIYWSFI